jgi:hypothetical protein
MRELVEFPTNVGENPRSPTAKVYKLSRRGFGLFFSIEYSAE